MHRRYTPPAVRLPPPVPFTQHDRGGNARRPRQLSEVRMRSLSMPKCASRSSLASPAFVPWDRSLRSSQPTYIPRPGIGATRCSSSKCSSEGQYSLPGIRPRAVSAVTQSTAATFKPSPPPSGGVAARRRSSAKTLCCPQDEGGLSTSLAEAVTPSSPLTEPAVTSRRSSLHQQRALRLILGNDTRDEIAALTAYTSPNTIVFAAYDTLRLLLIPLWRRHRYHLQLSRATATVAKYVLAKVHTRRRRQMERAADAVLRLLQSPHTQLLCAARQLEIRVVRIQRAFRLHRRSVQAVVELNYRKVRRDVEQAYWAAVVAQREMELAAQEPPTSAVAKAVQEVLDAKHEVHTRFGVVKRTSLVGKAHATATAAAVARSPVRTSYELDVYNYYMIGRLPESTLRSEIAAAVFAHTRRSAERARLLDDLCTPKLIRRTEATAVAGRAAALSPVVCRGSSAKVPQVRSVAHMPHFLPQSVYTSIMNNACYMTSLMRDDAMLRAHLRPSKSLLEPY